MNRIVTDIIANAADTANAADLEPSLEHMTPWAWYDAETGREHVNTHEGAASVFHDPDAYAVARANVTSGTWLMWNGGIEAAMDWVKANAGSGLPDGYARLVVDREMLLTAGMTCLALETDHEPVSPRADGLASVRPVKGWSEGRAWAFRLAWDALEGAGFIRDCGPVTPIVKLFKLRDRDRAELAYVLASQFSLSVIAGEITLTFATTTPLGGA